MSVHFKNQTNHDLQNENIIGFVVNIDKMNSDSTNRAKPLMISFEMCVVSISQNHNPEEKKSNKLKLICNNKNAPECIHCLIITVCPKRLGYISPFPFL